jgi:hypothetical protein
MLLKDENDQQRAARAALQRAVLNKFAGHLHLKNDAAISRALETQPPVISKWAHGTLPMGATAIIRMHEMTGWSTTEIKQMLNLPIAKRREVTK